MMHTACFLCQSFDYFIEYLLDRRLKNVTCPEMRNQIIFQPQSNIPRLKKLMFCLFRLMVFLVIICNP